MTLSSAEAIVVESISHPAILPADAVISPVVLTWKSDDEMWYGLLLELPYNLNPSGTDPIYVSSIDQPPIKPADAVIVPSKTAPLANNIPLELTEKLGPNLT